MAMDYVINDKLASDGLTTTMPKISQSFNVLPRYFSLRSGFVLPIPDTGGKSMLLLRPMYIKVEQLEKEFLVSSEISDIFEVGDTIKKAIRFYLYALIDEFIWLEKHKDTLSNLMCQDFERLQLYLNWL